MPVAAVGAQHLGGDERGEHHDGGRDEAVVVAVGGDDVGTSATSRSLEQHGDADEHDGRHVGDEDRRGRAGPCAEAGRLRPSAALHAVARSGCAPRRARRGAGPS